MDYTLHAELTHLLMENGAAVTKTSIDMLIQFIANRDKSIIEQVKKDADRLAQKLRADTVTDQ
jgi:hypothetical protein